MSVDKHVLLSAVRTVRLGHQVLIGHCTPSNGVTRWRSWLRHCATSRNVAVSIPDGVIAIFH